MPSKKFSPKRKQLSTPNMNSSILIGRGFDLFILSRVENGCAAATIQFYKNFYSSLDRFTLASYGKAAELCPVSILEAEGSQALFMESLGEVSIQTTNSYLRGWRAFGNYLQRKGYLSHFECRIREVEPPAKVLYSEREITKLLKKPDPGNFVECRNYTVVNLLLATGVRENTLLNIRIKDVDLEEGVIIFNTTKAHRVARLGLERRMRYVLEDFILSWRTGPDIYPDDYLFCNQNGYQLTRAGMASAIRKYNQSRGVDKTSIHLFRHTYAKNWITSGGDIITLSKVLTHSNLEMVKRYSNLYNSDITTAMEQHSTLSRARTRGGETLQTRRKKQKNNQIV